MQHKHLLGDLERATAGLKRVKPTIAAICDYSAGDPAAAKVHQALIRAFGDHHYTATSVRSFDTLGGSFTTLCQLLQPGRCAPPGLVGYLNVAPIEAGGDRNGHHPFCVLLMNNGTLIGSPNAGFSLSCLRPYAKAVFQVKTDQEGRQFRSWQSFPGPFGDVLLRQSFGLIERIWTPDDATLIPDLPAQDVVDFDDYGNIRFLRTECEVRRLGWRPGDAIELNTENGPVVTARYERLGNGEDGRSTIVIRGGSNLVQPSSEQPELAFLDGFVIRGSAYAMVCPDGQAVSDIRLRNVDLERRAAA